MQAPLSDPEHHRQRVLDELGLSNGAGSAALDAIARRLLRDTGWSVAGVSLVGADRQWFAAAAGLALPAAERASTFCGHAVTTGAALEVGDARLDPRFAQSPLIVSTPHLLAYAGVPLQVDGCTIGMLCAAHTAPAWLDPSARQALQDLGIAAAALLEAQLSARRSRRQEARVRGASRAGSDWLWETDAQGAITWVSASVEAHTGEPAQTHVGTLARSYNLPRQDEHRASYEAYLEARVRRRPFRDAVADRDTPKGRLTVSISGDPVFGSDGRFMGYRGATRVITEELALRQRAQRAELLLRGSVEHSHAAMMISDASGRTVVTNAVWRSRASRYLSEVPTDWPQLVAALVAAGAYPQARGREADFIAWRLALCESGSAMHELQFADTHQLVSDQRLADGSTVHMAIDITEHKRAQSALLEQQTRLTAVLRALPDLWFVLDREGRHLECSDEQHPWLLQPFGQQRGQLLTAVLPPDVAERATRAIDEALASGALQRFEYELGLPSGVRQFEGRMSPMAGQRVLYLVRDLTELHALEREVNLMQRAFEAAGSLPMAVADATKPDMPMVFVNNAFERLSGLPREALLGRNCRLLQGEDRDQPALQTVREAIAAGRGCSVTLRNQRADGTPFINELHLAPIHDSTGRLTHFVGVQNDITERSRAQLQLQRSEALYRSVTSAISDGLLVIGPDGVIVAINPAACRLLNATRDTLVGASPRRLGYLLLDMDGQPLDTAHDPVAEVLGGGPNVVDRALFVRRPDGMEREFSLSAHQLEGSTEAGSITCVVTFYDITEQRIAERGMAQAEARWRFALEEAGDGVLDYDEDTGRAFYSPRWKAMLGYADGEIGNSPQEWWHRIHPRDYLAVKQAAHRYRAGESAEYRTEHRLRHKDGHWVWVLDRSKIIEHRKDGSARRVVGIHTDITRLKAAEHAMRDKRAAELASESKSEFLSRMSHEMRTPLNAVIGFAQLLQMRGDAGQPLPVAQYSEHILQSGRHLLALVNDVLDLQQVEAGRLTLAPEAVPLQRALAAVWRLLEPAASARSVRGLIEVDEALCVWADPRRMKQVLLNLMSNSVKYNNEGGRVHCAVEAVTPGRVVLVIEDSGDGLDADQLARLFQPFERLGRETSAVEGSGLGLVIARALVKEMGGLLTMTSAPGVGSQVRVELPLAPAQASSTTPASPALHGKPPEALRMLYVEDNRINALLFEEAIKMRGGVDLRVVEDGPDALQLVEHWHPEVLVLDAHLPSMSGYQVLDLLRQMPRYAHTPAFMCSADALPDEIQRARDAGFTGYWSKPIDIAQVMKELDALPTAAGRAPP